MYRGQSKAIARGVLAVVLFSPFVLAGSENKSSESKETVIILPYIALGGELTGWHFLTGLSLRNARTAPQSVSVEIFDNDWEPLPVIVNGESEMAGRATWIIPAEDSREFVLTHPGGAIHDPGRRSCSLLQRKLPDPGVRRIDGLLETEPIALPHHRIASAARAPAPETTLSSAEGNGIVIFQLPDLNGYFRLTVSDPAY